MHPAGGSKQPDNAAMRFADGWGVPKLPAPPGANLHVRGRERILVPHTVETRVVGF
jgi:hypothetical protein